MADSTAAKLLTALQDEIGDASTGFFQTDIQLRAISRARQSLYRWNFLPATKDYAFDQVSGQEDYPIFGTGLIEDFGTDNDLRRLDTPTSTPVFYDWASPRQFADRTMERRAYTVRPIGGAQNLSVFPKPSLNVTGGFILSYFPLAQEFTSETDTYTDPLIEFYPLAADVVVFEATSRLKRQEGLGDEAAGYAAKAKDGLMLMLKAVPHKTKTRNSDLSFPADY